MYLNNLVIFTMKAHVLSFTFSHHLLHVLGSYSAHSLVFDIYPVMMSLSSHAQALSDSLARAGLVPGSAANLIPRDFRPSTQLSILFDGKQVDLGNLFRVTEVKTPPSVQFDPEVCCCRLIEST